MGDIGVGGIADIFYISIGEEVGNVPLLGFTDPRYGTEWTDASNAGCSQEDYLANASSAAAQMRLHGRNSVSSESKTVIARALGITVGEFERNVMYYGLY